MEKMPKLKRENKLVRKLYHNSQGLKKAKTSVFSLIAKKIYIIHKK